MKETNPITSLTEQEIRAFAEAFADYGYDKSTGERGLVYLFPERERLLDYLSAMIRSALSCGMLREPTVL